MTDIAPGGKSEVARIWQKIREEDAASWQVMYGMSATARHQFINKRLVGTLNYLEQFVPMLGEDGVMTIANEWQAQLTSDRRGSQQV